MDERGIWRREERYLINGRKIFGKRMKKVNGVKREEDATSERCKIAVEESEIWRGKERYLESGIIRRME